MFQLLFSQPLVFAVWIVAFILSLSVHEFSHAWVAELLGDSTAKRLGRLTLNPAAHIDPMGLLLVVMVGFGWGKPVPFNPYNLKWPKWGPVLIAFAGPFSNFLFAVITTILYAFLAPSLGEGNLLGIFLLIMAQLNIGLLAFNLIPLPPLDGSKALIALLSSPRFQQVRTFIETRGPIILLLLVIADSFSNLGFFSRVYGFATHLVLSVVTMIHPGS